MKIESRKKSHYGQTRKFANNIRVTFGKDGVADVSDATGQFLITRYPGLLFLQGSVPTSIPARVRGVGESPKTNETVEVLQEKLKSANHLLNDARAELRNAKDNEFIWRNKCEELLKFQGKGSATELQTKLQDAYLKIATLEEQNKSLLLAQMKEQPNESPEPMAQTKDDISLRTALETKTRMDLIVLAEKLQLSETEYKRLSKAKLIDYLIDKSKNANS